jgi:hypothetical protein
MSIPKVAASAATRSKVAASLSTSNLYRAEGLHEAPAGAV